MKTMVKIVPQVEEQFEMVSNKVFMLIKLSKIIGQKISLSC